VISNAKQSKVLYYYVVHQPARNAYDHHAGSRYRVSGTAYNASSVLLIYPLLSEHSDRLLCSTPPLGPSNETQWNNTAANTASQHHLTCRSTIPSARTPSPRSYLVSVSFPLVGICLPTQPTPAHRPSKHLGTARARLVQ
jgi:hypothetical protein